MPISELHSVDQTVSSPTEADEQQAFEYLQAESPALWLATYYHCDSRQGQPLRFDNREWMIDILEDGSPKIVCVKSSQIGVSEIFVVKLLSHARQGRSVMYVLPRDKDVWRFVPTRIDKVLRRVQFYHDNCIPQKKGGDKSVDTKGQKSLFGTDCYFVGANSEENFYMVPVDTLIIDEVNKCDQVNLQTANDRLESSDNPVKYMLGNPTFDGFGISAAYDESDKKQWFVQCTACNERQPLDWFENVVYTDDKGNYIPIGKDLGSIQTLTKDLDVFCRKCAKPIDRLGPGEWVAEFPSIIDVSGYTCLKLFADPRERPVVLEMFKTLVAAKSDLSMLQRVYNNILGVTFTAKGARIDEAVMTPCCDPTYSMPMMAEDTVCGVDVGGVLHVEIAEVLPDGRERLVCVQTLPLDLDALDLLVKQYGVRVGVMDMLPETKFVKDFLMTHPGWYKCQYVKADDSGMQLNVNYEEQTVKVNRTESLDWLLKSYIDKRIVLPSNWRNIDNGAFLKQMKASTRYKNMTKNPPRYVWDEAGQPDHYHHAGNYRTIASRIRRGGGGIG